MSPRFVWIVAPFIWEEEGRPLGLVLEEAEAVKVVCSSRVGRSLKTSRSPESFMSLEKWVRMGFLFLWYVGGRTYSGSVRVNM